MSWLSDHLFGTTKPRDTAAEAIASPTEVPAPASTPETAGPPVSSEIQNDTVTTSNTVSNSDDPSAYENRDVAAEWQVPVRGKLHKVEFEHGTTSGRRILWIDEKVQKLNNDCFQILKEYFFAIFSCKKPTHHKLYEK